MVSKRFLEIVSTKKLRLELGICFTVPDIYCVEIGYQVSEW